MSVDIGQVIEEGGRRTVARNGLYLVAIMWVLGVLNGLLGNTAASAAVERFPGPNGPGGMPFDGSITGPSLGLSPLVASLLSLVVGAVVLVVVGAAFRTFAAEDTETLPGERFTRKLPWMWVNLFVGWIAFWIAVTVGLVLLVVPGLFLLVSLFYFGVYVAVEDQNFVDGFSNSWSLTEGNRLTLFAIGVLVVTIAIVISAVFGVVGFAGGWIELLATQLGWAVSYVFILATTTRAFVQLRAGESATVEA